MTKVKICGLSTKEAVETAVRAGADYIGFVFARSKRQVSLEQAKELVKLVPKTVKKVGVFLSPTVAEVKETIAEVGLDLIQIHGQFDDASLEEFSLPIIRAYQVEQKVSGLSNSPAAFLLFDAPLAGSGQTFDWRQLDTNGVAHPFFIAGGLNEDNVLEAISYFSPYAVDVSSGVESEGNKDLAKIKKFIERVKHGI